MVAVLLLVFGLFTFWGSASIWGWTDILSSGSSSVVVSDIENGNKEERVMEKISL